MKTFNPLSVSSKFAICGLPVRVDTYKTCAFACKYCFSNNRKICEFEKNIQIADVKSVQRKLQRIFEQRKVDSSNFLDTLISSGIDWHMGGMSDPLQPIEKEIGATKSLLDVTNQYGIHMVVSTKSDRLYDCGFNPKLHSFQLSVSNVYNRKDIEPNVPDIASRLEFFNELKAAGFKVGIRIQPFIPGITSPEIIDMFKDADNFTIEGVKLVPQNKKHKEECLELFKLEATDFKQMGLLNLLPEIRLEAYTPFIEKLNKLNIPYSIADNDLHYLGKNKCCCGDALIRRSTDFNNTAMIKTFGLDYTKADIDRTLATCGVCNCKCNQYFTSNRQEGCITVKDFYDKRFDRKSSPFSPKFQYRDEYLIGA